ncbi:hypothetical protein MML61_22455 [Mycobacterium marinum]|uniref:hypothetical protein n=1 Tax=Mycobacterium marinum TaxID=1781 RepID=UPI002358988D|nr:hypothetical protein [Mycobacterium marinum]WCS17528.1 hypothetical protein MML61_22455 [Mycobacterium marinum]
MPQDWEPESWDESQASNVARQVNKLRGQRSAQWLSDETHQHGYRVSRATIADLENGRRRYVTVAEVAVLAAALNTAPVALLYPGPNYNEHIEVLPRIADRKIEAVQWFSGIRDHGFTDSPDGAQSARLRNEYQDHIRELRLWRELLDVYRKISSVRVPARRVNGEMVVGELSDAQLAQLDAYNDQVHFLRSQLGLEGLDDGG